MALFDNRGPRRAREPHVSDTEALLAVLAWTTAWLTIGHIIGAWPDGVRRALASKQIQFAPADAEIGAPQRQLRTEERPADEADRRARQAEWREREAKRRYLTLHQQ